MKKENFGGALPIGASSLLVIFAVVCLTVFALLTLSTAQADARLSAASAENAAAYYAADAQAQEILARLRAGELPEGVTEQDGLYCYECPISQTLTLAVTVQTDGEDYSILRWQTCAAQQWTPDDSLAVWDGEWAE